MMDIFYFIEDSLYFMHKMCRQQQKTYFQRYKRLYHNFESYI